MLESLIAGLCLAGSFASASGPDIDATPDRVTQRGERLGGPTAVPAIDATPDRVTRLDDRVGPPTSVPTIDATPDRVAHMDDRLGLPTFIWAERAPPGAPTPRDLGLSAEEAARAQLARNAPLYRLEPGELNRAVVSGVHDTGAGAIIVSFGARPGGLPLFRDSLHVVMDRSLRAVALTGYLPPLALRGTAAPPFTLGAEAALSVAHSAEGGPAGSRWVDLGAEPGGYRRFELASHATSTARVRRVVFSLPERLEPGFYVELSLSAPGATTSNATSYVVSARDGRVLFRHGLTSNAFDYRVWADPTSLVPFDGPQGNAATPHPTGLPDGYQAPFVAPQLVSVQAGPLSTGDPWLPAGATETTGNNVDAYADLSAPDGFGSGDLRASVTAAGTFDRVYDTAQAPRASSTQTQASVTQLFYTLNFLHDWYYDAGFDEASGNAQAQNLGRGGLENDRLLAETQDYDGRTNANMTTFADGARARLQVFVFDANLRHRVTVSAPASIAGDYDAGLADFGPGAFQLTGTLLKVNDGTAPSGDGCELPFANAAALAGKVALLDRGTCTFAAKVANAQAAGAIAAVVGNNASGAAPPMPGTDPSITIPSFSLSQADAARLEAQLGAGVTVTLERESGVDRDGALDNAVVAHEWGHYLSDRLIGDANGLSNKMGKGLGEGWSDFQALLMMAREQDALVASNPGFGGTYTLAGYVHSGGGNNGYYYGLRRLPYSTDFAKNALTFKHLADGEPLPIGVPTAFGQSGANNSEVHNAGEVWATMLWDGYVALLRAAPRLSFAQAQDRMKRYLVASLKATPVSPTLLEARDALLAVSYAGDPQDHLLLAQAFARRGAGLRALAPPRDSQTHTPLVEDFTTGGDLAVSGAALNDEALPCDADGFLDNEETGTLTVTVRNIGSGALDATTGTVSSTTPGVTFPRGAALTFGPSQPFGTATAVAEVSLSGASAVTALDFTVSVTDPGLAIPGPVAGAASFRGNLDDQAAASTSDDVEAPSTVWTTGRDPNLPAPQRWSRRELSALEHVWFAPGPSRLGDLYLVSPPLQVSATGTFGFTFRHRYRLEARTSPVVLLDAAVLELSDDDGATWTDIGAAATPGYDGTVLGTGNSALKGRPAFGGTSPGYPAFTHTTVDLGTAHQGKAVRLRFRLASDEAVAQEGWDIDDVAFTGIDGTPFGQAVADPGGGCVERPPVVAPPEPDLGVSGGCGCQAQGGGGQFLLLVVLGALATLPRRPRR